MRILYGIQGTGNGHLTRAMELLPELQKRAKVDTLLSGSHSELRLPIEPTYTMNGLGFVFGKKGGIDLVETYRKSQLKKFYREVKGLDLSAYDFVISDFEPITAWAAMQQEKVSVGLSNQVALLSPHVPKASNEDMVGKFIIRHYAPTNLSIGLSYKAYADGIHTPIIRKELREKELSDKGHYVVYLPSYADAKILKVLRLFPEIEWQVFSKYAQVPYVEGHIRINPLQKESFETAILSATGVVTAAGFGTTTEALFMGKKLLVIPQKHQYEQACNAKALATLGVKVVKSFKPKHYEKIDQWLTYGHPIKMDYPDRVSEMVDDLFFQVYQKEDHYTQYLLHDQYALRTA